MLDLLTAQKKPPPAIRPDLLNFVLGTDKPRRVTGCTCYYSNLGNLF